MIETPHLFPVKDHLHESDTVVHRIIKGKKTNKSPLRAANSKGRKFCSEGKDNPSATWLISSS